MYPPIEVKSLMQESMIDRCARRFGMIGCPDPDLFSQKLLLRGNQGLIPTESHLAVSMHQQQQNEVA